MILLLILQNVQLDKPESNDDFLPRKLFMFGIDTFCCQPKVSLQKYVHEQSNTKNLTIHLETFCCKCSKLRITVLHALLPSLTFGKRHDIIKLAYYFFFIQPATCYSSTHLYEEIDNYRKEETNQQSPCAKKPKVREKNREIVFG